MSALPEPELDPPVVPDDEPGEPALEELPDFAAEDPVVFDDAAEPVVPVELLELSVDAVHVVEAVLDVESVSAASSVASVDLAEASVAFASMSALVSAAVSRVASVWPAVTVSPTPTGAVSTVADDVGETLAWLDACTVPVTESTCSTDPLVTGTVR